MITVKIKIDQVLAEYIRGKYFDERAGVVRFSSNDDIYHTIYNLMERRPAGAVDRGNLEFALPDRREGDLAGGKNPEQYNYISTRGAEILASRFRVMMWSELHDFMDENKHVEGIQFKESAFLFLKRYCIEAISEDALIKNYQRWREKVRRRRKRAYNRRK